MSLAAPLAPLTSAQLRHQRDRIVSFGHQWLYQTLALIRKNVTLLTKQLRVTLFILTLPLLALGLTFVLTAIYNRLLSSISNLYTIDHTPFSANVGRCQSFNMLYALDSSIPCTSLIYSPSNSWTDAVMQEVAAGLPQLTFGVDVVGMQDNTTMFLDWANNLGKRDIGIVFQSLWYPFTQRARTPVPLAEYQQAYMLYYNSTGYSGPGSDDSSSYYRVPAIQYLLEAALVNALAHNISRAFPRSTPPSSSPTQPLPSLNSFSLYQPNLGQAAQVSDLQFQFIPQVLPDDTYTQGVSTRVLTSVNSNAVGAALGGPLLVLGATIACLLLIQMVASEKQGKLLALMRMSKLKESAYWTSYLVIFALLALPASLFTCALGVGYGLSIFVNVDFGLHFVALWLMLIAMSAVALLIASLWTQPRWVNLFSFLFLALCLLSTVYLNANAYYDIKQPSGSGFFLALAPWFHYGRVWNDAARHSQLTYPVNTTAQQEWVTANSNVTRQTPYPQARQMRLPNQVQQTFSWSQSHERQLIVSPNYSNLCNPFDAVCCDYWNSVQDNAACYYSNSTQFSFAMMLVLTAGYTLLAWWLSQTTNVLGGGKPWYFPLRPKYWMETRRHATKVLQREGDEEAVAQAVADERDLFDRELRLSAEEGSVRTIKLSKAYKRVSAVKELSVQMARGQVFCLLGGNGAGKSTVINVLSGLVRPTFGEAFICGYSVREDLNHVQDLVSVCHQDNVLWPQLTVYQHMTLQCALRCLKPELIPDTVERLLRLVSLWLHRRKRSDELSGGMKRRLCMALALVGDPAVVLLDECCSGLDPMHKVEVWEVIQRLKHERVVLLTTHSMAEAEFLGDQVGLLADGRLTAVGSPQFLKEHYGKGYQLQLLVQPAHVPQVVTAIKRHITNCDILGTEGGSICIAVKRHQLKVLLDFMNWAQSHPPSLRFDRADLPSSSALSPTNAQLVREWSLTQSSLEEIFLRFCARQQTVNAADLLESGVSKELVDDVDSTATDDAESNRAVSGAVVANDDDDGAAVPYTSTTWAQVRSVLFKNWAMMRSERRSWLARLLVLVLILLLLIYLVLNSRRSDLCPQGYTANPYTAPCDPMSFVNAVFNPATAQFGGGYGTMSLDAQVDVTRFNQSTYLLPLWFNGQDGGNQGPNYVFNGPALRTLDLGQGVVGVVNTSAVPTWPRNGLQPFNLSTPTFVDYSALMASDGAVDLIAQLVLNQQLILSHFNDTALSSRLGDCSSLQTSYGQTLPPSWYIEDDTTANALAQWLYPTGGVQLLNATIAADASRLSYRILSWASEVLYETPSISYPIRRGSIDSQYQCNFVSPATGSSVYNQNLNMLIHGVSHALLYTTLHRMSSYVEQQAAASPATNPWRNVSAPLISGTIVAINGPQFSGAIDPLTLSMCVALMTFVMTLLLPWYSDRILYEREQQLFFMMRLAGMRPACYWLGNYLFDLSVAWVWNVTVVVLGYAMGLGLFVGSDLALWLVLLIVWTHVQVGMSWFIAALFSRRTLAGITLHVFVIVLVLYAFVLEVVAMGYGYVVSLQNFVYPTSLLIFPPFAFVRCLSLIIRDSGGLGALAVGTDLSQALLALLLIGTGFMLVGWLLHTVQYRTWRSLIEEVPCYRGPKAQAKHIDAVHEGRSRMTTVNQSLLSPASHAAMQREEEDIKVDSESDLTPELSEDLRAEIDRAKRYIGGGGGDGDKRAATAVCISGLSKTYDKLGVVRTLRKLFRIRSEDDHARVVDAVHDLSLVVGYGECFGLLGPNGAGKSTLLSILSGLTRPSGGRALINGHDVQFELPAVYSSLGICPQHDRLFNDLTTRQHLLFYARLKGVPAADERSVVYRIALRVQLDGDALDQKVVHLSGGMKRRLSIAISLVGNPMVWLLDEPSTGLSAEARRSVWQIVSAQTAKRRCTLITTHMMEEADTLSSRVGIMCHGRLQCIGTPAQLKCRYAHQLTLTLTVVDDRPLDVDPNTDPTQLHFALTQGQAGSVTARGLLGFVVEQVAPSAKLRAVHGQRMLFSLLQSEVGWGDEGGRVDNAAQLRSVLPVFERLAALQPRMKAELGMSAWYVSQASLDDVFVQVVKASEADAPPDPDLVE